MRVLKVLALAALSFTALAAKKAPSSTPDLFAKYAASSSPAILDETTYNELTKGPRDYTAAVLLTALDTKYACQVCKDFDPEWTLLARSWRRADKKGALRTMFGTLDFDKGRNIFIQMQLQTAPVLLLFPPTTGPNAPAKPVVERFDFIGPQTADSINSWISRHMPGGKQYPSIVRPVNYGRIISGIFLVAGGVTFLKTTWRYIWPAAQNRNVWSALSLVMVLLFTSGHMFNHIRKVPYVSGDGKGGITYFAGGFGNQFGMETQIIAAIYAVLSFALISLALKVPRMKDAKAQQLAAIVWVSIMFGLYSFLISVFRIKNGGYPFWLPPF